MKPKGPKSGTLVWPCRKKQTVERIIIHECKRKADAREAGVALIAGSPTRPQPRRRPITRKDYAQGQGHADSALRTRGRSLRGDIATNPRGTPPDMRFAIVRLLRQTHSGCGKYFYTIVYKYDV